LRQVIQLSALLRPDLLEVGAQRAAAIKPMPNGCIAGLCEACSDHC
jgi:hypothetical protein